MLRILLVFIVLYIIFSLLDEQGEGFSVANLADKVEMCQRFGGCAICGEDGKQLCQLPTTIQNEQILNWQLAGRVCDLDYLYETQGCRTPNRPENPYAQNANRGIFHYNV